jgi:hypothetical protein
MTCIKKTLLNMMANLTSVSHTGCKLQLCNKHVGFIALMLVGVLP